MMPCVLASSLDMHIRTLIKTWIFVIQITVVRGCIARTRSARETCTDFNAVAKLQFCKTGCRNRNLMHALEGVRGGLEQCALFHVMQHGITIPTCFMIYHPYKVQNLHTSESAHAKALPIRFLYICKRLDARKSRCENKLYVLRLKRF